MFNAEATCVKKSWRERATFRQTAVNVQLKRLCVQNFKLAFKLFSFPASGGVFLVNDWWLLSAFPQHRQWSSSSSSSSSLSQRDVNRTHYC